MPKRRTCEIITMHSDKTKPTQKPLERHRPGRTLWSLCLLRTGSLGAKDKSGGAAVPSAEPAVPGAQRPCRGVGSGAPLLRLCLRGLTCEPR